MRKISVLSWFCYIIGYVFILTGVLKLLDTDFIGIFSNLGLPFPTFTLLLVAWSEIICGVFIVARRYVSFAVIPLLIIMIGALYMTKIPILINDGMMAFAFDSRLDVVMLILLIALWQNRVQIEQA